jgi:heme oxygenase
MPQQLVGPDLTIPAYRTILTVYHRYYTAIEPAIEHCLAAAGSPFDYVERRKRPWLEQDLARFGGSPPPVPLPPAVHLLTRLSSLGEAIGVLYAIEGSTLGGQVISRHVGRSLQVDADSGGRFFTGYGAETEARWLQFCQFAEQIAGAPAELQAALRAAERAFTAMEQSFDAQH